MTKIFKFIQKTCQFRLKSIKFWLKSQQPSFRLTTNTTFLGLAMTILLSGCSHLSGGILHPKGFIASQEKTLMLDSIALMLIVVIPVIIMSLAFAFRYRAKNNNNSTYKPNWSHSLFLESIWWGIPCIIIVVLGIMTWRSTHKLDPYRPLDMPGKPILVEAVALEWKWLFIYPKQKIATLNYLTLPKNRQVEFWITSDAPMSSFFIPQLASQIYAMAGMRTRLHLVANQEGVYQGLNSQYNGDGFSEMKFKVKVTSQVNFNKWVNSVKQSKLTLNIPEYQKIVKPTKANPAELYGSVVPKLFNRIMMQYRKPNMDLH